MTQVVIVANPQSVQYGKAKSGDYLTVENHLYLETANGAVNLATGRKHSIHPDAHVVIHKSVKILIEE